MVYRESKRRAEELGINIGFLVKRKLEDEFKREELENLPKNLTQELNKDTHLPEGINAGIICESRECQFVERNI